MTDNKLVYEEDRRAVQHETVKSQVEADVNSQIAARAEQARPQDNGQIDQVAGEFRHKAINEVVETEREVERSRGLARVSQVVDYLFFILYALLSLRLLLALMAARPSAGFVRFIHNITEPFYAPFRGIVGSPSIEGGYTLALPIILALIVYVLLHLGINGLLRMLAHRKTSI